MAAPEGYSWNRRFLTDEFRESFIHSNSFTSKSCVGDKIHTHIDNLKL